MSRQTRIGVLEILTAVLVLSFSGPLVRWAAMPSGVLTFVRTAVPSFILGTWLLVRRRTRPADRLPPSRGRLMRLFAASSLNAVRMWLFFESFRLTSVANAIIVLYTWPVFALISGALLLKERLVARDVVLLILAFSGMVIVYSGGRMAFSDRDFLGMTLMLISAALYALMLILIRRENVGRIQATFWQNLVGAVAFFTAFIGALGGPPAESWILAGTLGLVIGTGAFALFFSALHRLPSAVVGHFSYLEVVFALIWGVVLLSEPLTWRHGVGGGFIVVSMLVRGELARRDRRRFAAAIDEQPP